LKVPGALTWRGGGTLGPIAAVAVGLGSLVLAYGLNASPARAEPNDSMATAQGPVTSSFTGAISTENDVDWYFMYAQGSTQLGVGLTTFGPFGSCWSTVQLRDPAGEFLSEATAFKNEVDQIHYTLPTPGTYYLEVDGGDCSSLGSYRIDLSAAPPLLTSPPYVLPPPPPPATPARRTPAPRPPAGSRDVSPSANCERARAWVGRLQRRQRQAHRLPLRARRREQAFLRHRLRRAYDHVRRQC
jgi:hypothetical protein